MHSSNTLEHGGLLSCLLSDGLINIIAAKEAALAISKQEITLTQYLVKNNLLASDVILHYCEKKFSLPIYHYDSNKLCILNSNISSELIYRYRIIPLIDEQQHFYLGVTDPTDHAAITAISFQTGTSAKLLLLAEDDVEKIISTQVKPSILNSQLETALLRMEPNESLLLTEENSDRDDEPVIEFVNSIINDAIENKISDIHIEPYADYCRIRFRRDGLLYEATVVPHHLATRITTRLKIMAQLNIAERRLPQDGRILLREPQKLDIRINTCPTLFGEKIVLRLLTIDSKQIDITTLGLTPLQHSLFLANLKKPQGLILVTGPTGSGKTITLYSALHYLNQIEKNISSAEDPIEIELPGINQVNVNSKIGLDFAAILRTFLRQDPDIIMVGEIRDNETANIAMQAAQTGHLVLATLHTNNAIETITRLTAMGISTFNMVTSLSLMIAQRLVRKLCSQCKIIADIPAHLVPDDKFNLSQTYHSVGCNHCHQGYQGRIGIFEFIPMTEELRRMILAGANTMALVEYAQKEKWPTLWESGLLKVRTGVTSFAEIIRVTSR